MSQYNSEGSSDSPTDGGSARLSVGVAIAPVVRELEMLRASSRRRLLVTAVGLVAAVYIVGATLVGSMDFFLRLPGWVRVGMWVIGVAVLIAVVRRWWLPAWRFRPTLTQMALRLEQTPDARRAGLPGVLAAGMELAARAHEEGVTGDLSEEVVIEAARRLRAIRPRAALFRNGRVRTSLAALTLSLVPVGALGVLLPSLTLIGAQRVLLPWGGAVWPKRTSVVDATRLDAHPIGTALPMRALLTRTPRALGKTDVLVKYRIVGGGRSGVERSMLLTSQGQKMADDMGPIGVSGATGELFERLFEPSALVAAGGVRDAELVYWFETEDDSTPQKRILLVEPPSVRAASVEVEPPAYTQGKLRDTSAFVQGTRDAGNGTDQRSTIGPILAGSRVRLSLELSKPLAGPKDTKPESLTAFVASVVPGLAGAKDLTGSFAPTSWAFEWTLDSSRAVSALLVDEHRISGVEDGIFRFEAVADKAPSISVVDPSQDEAVLPTAVIPATAEARDDVALGSVELWMQRAERDPASIGAAPEAKGAPTRAALSDGSTGESGVSKATIELQLTPLELKPGDELWLTGVAVDVFEFEGKPREPVVSAIRRLRVISDTEFVEQVRSDLSALRDSAMRLQKEQKRLADSRDAAARDADEAARQSPAQGAIKERLGPMDDAVRRLAQRLERNRLDDEGLRGVLDDAGQLLEQAAAGATEAKRALDELKRPPATQADREKESAALEGSQNDVDEALAELTQMLDSGKDSWAVRRQLEKLLTEQRQLESQTRAAGEQTRGKAEGELSPKEREDLERLAARQKELSQQAAAVVEALRERGDQMQGADPGQAQAMQQAAKRAQQKQLENAQREAAKKIQENKTGEAEEDQKQAAQTIEEMLEDLDDVQQKRDEALRRELAQVIESLKQLVTRQEAELAALGAAVQGGAAGESIQKLDVGMISLQRDTLAVRDRTLEQMKDAELLHELLGAAGDAESMAISALRQSPGDASEADEQERISLQNLRQALAEAERLEQSAEDREDARRRAELLKVYREALEAQLAVLGETKPLVGKTLTRKERGVARALGTRQGDLRDPLAAIRAKTTELSEAKVFDAALRRLDQAMDGAAKSLADGTAPASVGRQQQTSVDVLRALVEAFKDAQQEKDFKEANEGGGGSGSGGQSKPEPLLPPIAQLKLLRGMQAEAAARTRSVSDAKESDSLEDITALQVELETLGRGILEELKQSGPDAGDRPAPQPVVPPGPEPSSPVQAVEVSR